MRSMTLRSCKPVTSRGVTVKLLRELEARGGDGVVAVDQSREVFLDWGSFSEVV